MRVWNGEEKATIFLASSRTRITNFAAHEYGTSLRMLQKPRKIGVFAGFFRKSGITIGTKSVIDQLKKVVFAFKIAGFMRALDYVAARLCVSGSVLTPVLLAASVTFIVVSGALAEDSGRPQICSQNRDFCVNIPSEMTPAEATPPVLLNLAARARDSTLTFNVLVQPLTLSKLRTEPHALAEAISDDYRKVGIQADEARGLDPVEVCGEKAARAELGYQYSGEQRRSIVTIIPAGQLEYVATFITAQNAAQQQLLLLTEILASAKCTGISAPDQEDHQGRSSALSLNWLISAILVFGVLVLLAYRRYSR